MQAKGTGSCNRPSDIIPYVNASGEGPCSSADGRPGCMIPLGDGSEISFTRRIVSRVRNVKNDRRERTGFPERTSDTMLTFMRNILRARACLLFTAVLLAGTMSAGCSFGTRLETASALPADAAGTYRLYLYGCHYPADIENMALLVDQSAPYRFDLFVLDTSYRIKQELSGPAALAEADAFIRCSTETLWLTVFRRILDPAGRTIAFELKPLYEPLRRGTDEVLQTNYSLKDGTVTVYIRRNPLLRREDGGGDSKGTDK